MLRPGPNPPVQTDQATPPPFSPDPCEPPSRTGVRGFRENEEQERAPERVEELGQQRGQERDGIHSVAEKVSKALRTAPELTMRAPARSISSTERAPSPTCLLKGRQASATM